MPESRAPFLQALFKMIIDIPWKEEDSAVKEVREMPG